MDSIKCPFCSHECRPTAVMCPSCGLTFQRWLEANPGKTIEGWTPPTAATAAPAAPAPASPVAPAPPPVSAEGAGTRAAVVIAREPEAGAGEESPPPSLTVGTATTVVTAKVPAGGGDGERPDLDPRAKALIEMYKAEAAFRKNPAEADRAPGRAAILFIVMGITNILFGLLLSLQRFPGDGLAFTSSFVGGPAFVIAAIGALNGRRAFVRAGLVLAVVDLAICATTWSKVGVGLHNATGFKLIMVAYLVKLIVDLG